MAKVNSPTETIRPYGDRRDDGRLQLSFTLPVPAGARAREAARLYCEKLGLAHVQVATMETAGSGFSFFVVYASSAVALDFASVSVPEVTAPDWDFDEINRTIREQIKRKVIVVGACTGSDAHTVGIDAILNIKGFAGDKGLEAYPWFETYNLGAQVDNLVLLARAEELRADVVLVSQIMTQRDLHMDNSRSLIDLAKRRAQRDILFILGGPRIDHKLALALGFDAGFGPGTRPSQVAAFVAQQLAGRRRGAP